ncbi:MAG: diacylglycerol kinase family lipid kinase [Tissierellia bacterium]|nr:diacylglycerol kinase family lipid kinase [Tissierellia bacterium]
MKRIKFIVNPSAGTQMHGEIIDEICKRLLDHGHILQKFNTRKQFDALQEAKNTRRKDWDMILCSGGDGTVNEVVTGIVQGGEGIPLGIYSAGTVNDFANFMNLPKTAKDFVAMVEDFHQRKIDIGYCKDRCFANVLAIGNIANVGHETDKNAKAIFGRLAYLFEGFKEVPNTLQNPFRLRFRTGNKDYSERVVLATLSNSSSIGGFQKFSPDAKIDDGLLDLVLIKAAPITDLVGVFLKILQGEHVKDPGVIYRQVDEIEILGRKKLPVDLDGEFAGYLPLNVKVLKQKVNLIVVKE